MALFSGPTIRVYSALTDSRDCKYSILTVKKICFFFYALYMCKYNTIFYIAIAHTLNTLSTVSNVESIWTDTCHGSQRQGILNYTFLSSSTWIAKLARILATISDTCKSGKAISIHATFRIFSNHS